MVKLCWGEAPKSNGATALLQNAESPISVPKNLNFYKFLVSVFDGSTPQPSAKRSSRSHSGISSRAPVSC